MKASEVCSTAIAAGLGKFGPIKYRTKSGDWRYNVGLWTGACWSFDCLGFVHCMVNGFVGNKAELGGGAVMDEFVTHSDELTTLSRYCYDVSGDFRNLTPGELLYMDGHVGLYVGNIEPFGDGRIFNVAECCYSSWGGGGLLSYVGPSGERVNHKGGSQAGYWTRHGKFYRVDYDEAAPVVPDPDEPIPECTPADILNIVNDTFVGVYGNNPDREKVLTEKYGKTVYRQVQDILNILYR